MHAVVAMRRPSRDELEYERRVLHGELSRWGDWIDRNSDYEGYPGCNILAAYIGGSGGDKRGHRILCRDMPASIWATHARIVLLQEEEQEAVWLLYANRLREDGTLRPLEEKLRVAKISLADHRAMMASARRKIMGIDVK